MLKTANELFLSERVFQLEEAIRIHRSQKADDRCIEDDDRLYAVLGDGIKCDRQVGCKEDMLRNCQRFIENRCEGGEWPSYAELEEKLSKVVQFIKDYYTILYEQIPKEDATSIKLIQEIENGSFLNGKCSI